MQHLLVVFITLFCSLSLASSWSEVISLNEKAVSIRTDFNKKFGSFDKFDVDGFENTKEVGAPELPVKSWLLIGNASDIKVKANILKVKILEDVRPYPVQTQDCRCDHVSKKGFEFDSEKYEQKRPLFTLNHLGFFRGLPITRLDLNLATYKAQTNNVDLITEIKIEVNSSVFSLAKDTYNDYLIVVKKELAEGIIDFVNWKKSLGYNVRVETFEEKLGTTNLAELIKTSYHNNNTDFVMMIGSTSFFPMYSVSTSGSSSTPSDLKYFTMDGAGDYIPDMFYSRILAVDATDVKNQLAKSIEFEQGSFQNSSGLTKFIGIASNEGASPSDNEYVLSIGKKMKDFLNVDVLHLYQNDKQNSNPATLNKALDEGAFWLTYMGHGSGFSWPSMYKSYSTSHIKELNNKNSVKPIIIDVACMNGFLEGRYLGTSFVSLDQGQSGALAYYGGSVNISWHPPAIMARGITFEHMDKKFKHLGEALLAGQLYLAANWNNTTDVVDNFEWYHLQGDPSLNIEF